MAPRYDRIVAIAGIHLAFSFTVVEGDSEDG